MSLYQTLTAATQSYINAKKAAGAKDNDTGIFRAKRCLNDFANIYNAEVSEYQKFLRVMAYLNSSDFNIVSRHGIPVSLSSKDLYLQLTQAIMSYIDANNKTYADSTPLTNFVNNHLVTKAYSGGNAALSYKLTAEESFNHFFTYDEFAENFRYIQRNFLANSFPGTGCKPMLFAPPTGSKKCIELGDIKLAYAGVTRKANSN